MSILSNCMTEELRNVARQRNIDGYENMFRQLENIFTSVSISNRVPIPICKNARTNFKPRKIKDAFNNASLNSPKWIKSD